MLTYSGLCFSGGEDESEICTGATRPSKANHLYLLLKELGEAGGGALSNPARPN